MVVFLRFLQEDCNACEAASVGEFAAMKVCEAFVQGRIEDCWNSADFDLEVSGCYCTTTVHMYMQPFMARVDQLEALLIRWKEN